MTETMIETTPVIPKTAHETARAYEDALSVTPPTNGAASGEAAPATSEPVVNGNHVESLPEGLRLRMKIWTDPATAARYLMASAFMRDVVNGQPVSDVMYAYAMRDGDTKLVTLVVREWNALPFHYFKEDGAAPRATERPLDSVEVTTGKIV